MLGAELVDDSGERLVVVEGVPVVDHDVMAGTVVVHDRYTLYDNKAFTGIVHQLCTQHLLRDLAGAGEVYPDAVWPAQIADALRALIHHANLARAGGEEQVDPDIRAELVKTPR